MDMKKYILFTWICSLVFTWGCSDWLEIDPKTELSADQLFENERGFIVALNGVYSGMASNNLYGGELTYGAIEVLGRNVVSEKVLYKELRNYNYEYTSVKSLISNVWEKSYNLIANCNEILERVDAKGKDFFTGNNYELVKGQALAARAMLHFDIARFFAPHPSQEDVMLLPYNEKITYLTSQSLRTSEFMGKVIRDFMASKDLLAVNDTLPDGKLEMKNLRFSYSQSSMDKYMGYRFNYYSVTALLARVALWAGDKELANENVRDLLSIKYNNSAVVTFTTASSINSNKCDRLFSDDILFGLYRKTEELTETFNQLAGISYIANYTNVFNSDEADLRKNLVEVLPGNNYRTYKYSATHFQKDRNYLLPVIRLSEMYYIMGEILVDTDLKKASEQLDYVRKQRGVKTNLNVPSDRATFVDMLIREVRRETLGEGQLFFYYKRLNYPVLDEKEGNQVLNGEFTFPIPDVETVG